MNATTLGSILRKQLLLLGQFTMMTASICLCLATHAPAQERAKEFLQALRDRGYYDVANDYLTECETNPLVEDSFRARIPIERAENLIQSISSTRNVAVWIERLGEAEAILEAFTQSSSNEDLKGAAIESLANLRFNQARSYLLQSESDRMTQSEKEEKFTLARNAFDQSVKAFDDARERLRAQIETMTPQVKSNPDLRTELEGLQNRYIVIRLRSPMIREYSADTYPLGHERKKQLLEDAVKEYLELWDKYSGSTAGLDACLYAARCYNKLGSPEKALPLLNELLQLEDKPTLKSIRQLAAMTAVETWEASQPYPFDQVIFHLEPMTSGLTNAEQREPNWAAIQLGLARAYRARASNISSTNSGSAADANRANKLAAMMAKRASRSSGPIRDAARQALLEWDIKLADTDDASEEVVTNFVDAKARAIELLGDLEESYTRLIEAKIQFNSADPTKKEESGKLIEELKEEVQGSAKSVLALLNKALEFPKADVEAAEVNHARYLQAYAYFTQERYYEPLALGQFAIDRNSGVEWSRQIAGLGLKAIAGLYEQAPDADRAFELEQLQLLGDRIINRWPGTPESSQAAAILARLAMANNDAEAAKKYSAAMSSESSGRSGVGLRLAQQQWRDFKLAKKSLSPEQQQAQAADLKAEAQSIVSELESGLSDFTSETINYDAAYTALLLVNAWLEVGNPDRAVAQLETANVAPLDLIKQKHPSVVNSEFANLYMKETYRTAISAYLASMKSGQDAQNWISRTQGVLQALQELLEKTAGDSASTEMTAIYGMVTAELKEQFAGMKDPQEKINLARNLANFLESMSRDSTQCDVLLWAGQTLMETAASLKNADANEVTTSIYQQAVAALTKAEGSDLSGQSNPDLTKIRIRRAKALALAGAGKYEEAIAEFGSLLAERNALELQIDAAATLQEWGNKTNRIRAYEEAMMGGGPNVVDPKTKRSAPAIWGWRKLITATRSQDKLIDSFHEVNIKLMECQLEYSIAAKSAPAIAAKSDQALNAAKTEMERTKARFPELGGQKFKSRYLALEQRLGNQ